MLSRLTILEKEKQSIFKSVTFYWGGLAYRRVNVLAQGPCQHSEYRQIFVEIYLIFAHSKYLAEDSSPVIAWGGTELGESEGKVIP